MTGQFSQLIHSCTLTPGTLMKLFLSVAGHLFKNRISIYFLSDRLRTIFMLSIYYSSVQFVLFHIMLL